MFGFGKRAESPERRVFREEFEQTIAKLRGADDAIQAAVAHAINMANTFFMQTHGSPEGFLQLPKEEQHAYLAKLTSMENKFADQGDAASSMGFGLFKMWLGTVAAGDDELNAKFNRELALLSRKAPG